MSVEINRRRRYLLWQSRVALFITSRIPGACRKKGFPRQALSPLITEAAGIQQVKIIPEYSGHNPTVLRKGNGEG